MKINMLPNMLFLLSFAFLTSSAQLFSQTVTSEKTVVQEVIRTLFLGVQKADTLSIKTVLHSSVSLMTSSLDENGSPIITPTPISSWLNGIGSAQAGMLDEQLDYIAVRVDSDRMAQAWTPYRFYINGKFSHCGTNNFQLAKQGDIWLITAIIDTRNKSGCDESTVLVKEKLQSSLDSLMNGWHRDAATGQFDAYFNAMADKAIFIGTDETEVWNKQQFMAYAKAPFSDGKGWDFTHKRRAWFYAEDYETAWFDEDLITPFGICRGSGVIEKVSGKNWKIQQYILTLTIPNDKMDTVREFIKND